MVGELKPDELWNHWEWPLLPLITCVTAAVIYLLGWLSARRTRPRELPLWRALSFEAGILIFWLAIASPISAFDDYLLTAHMFQHFLLMSVAPPLIVLGAPAVPFLRGFPRFIVRQIIAPLITWHGFVRFWHILLHPVTVWLLMNITYVAWHIPRFFNLTFESETLHDLEHAMFFFTSCAFWWIVLSPWPAKRSWSWWSMAPYLLTADLINTILCALMTFSGRVFYNPYLEAPRLTRLTALQDQIAAGAEMWVLNSCIFLGFAAYIVITALTPARSPKTRTNTNFHSGKEPIETRQEAPRVLRG